MHSKLGLMRAAGSLCGLGVMSAVIASPPAIRDSKSLPRLDLRPPGVSSATSGAGSRYSPGHTDFPSSIQRLDLPKTGLGEGEPMPRFTLGAGELNFRVRSPAQAFARRVHEEGLPIARLWQSKSAALSIGLSRKGKPGLWLTQKLH